MPEPDAWVRTDTTKDRELTPAELRRAALNTCAAATDVHEAREFMGMLGLTEQLREASPM